MFDRSFSDRQLSDIGDVRNWIRPEIKRLADLPRKPVVIVVGLLVTAVEVALRAGIEKEVLVANLRRFASHIEKGTLQIMFEPDQVKLRDKK